MTENFGNQNRKGKNGRHRNYGSNNRISYNSDVVHMSNYKWCHGPKCHKSHTQDRVRGSKGSKVLRTRKVKEYKYHQDSIYKYFCSQGCYTQFANTHAERIVAIAPRNTPLETPIDDPKKVTHTSDYNSGYTWTSTEIKERGVDTQTEQEYIGYRKDTYI